MAIPGFLDLARRHVWNTWTLTNHYLRRAALCGEGYCSYEEHSSELDTVKLHGFAACDR